MCHPFAGTLTRDTGTQRKSTERKIVWLVVLLVGFATSCDRRTRSSGKPVVMVFSGDTAGWITPCGCTANQSGGLLRRGTYLRSLEGRADVHYFDVGGAASGTSDYFKMKFEAILAGEALMKITAHNLGGPELAMGAEYLREVSRRMRVHFISSNARDSDGAGIGEDMIAMNVSGKKIAVIGVVSQRYGSSGIRIDDPKEAILRRVFGRVKYDSVIVLAYMPDEELEALAAALPEVDAVIGGPTGQAIAPKRMGPTLVASATNKGKFLIQLTANRGANAAGWAGEVVQMDAGIADDAGQQRNLETYLSRLASADFVASESGVVAELPARMPISFRVAGSQACASCHVADDHAWEISKHARAGEDLVPRHFEADPSCLQCHTTGFALPGGFVSPKRTPELAGAGCENCHGPSEGHVKNSAVRTPFVAMDQCVRCHDEENSPRFERAAYWARIRHGVKLKPAP